MCTFAGKVTGTLKEVTRIREKTQGPEEESQEHVINHRDMAKKTEKTNAARLLDKAGVKYNLIPYECDENDLSAQHVADSLGQDKGV